MAKVTELLKSKGQLSYSFEVTPDISEEEIDELKVDATFFSVTWHAKSHQCRDLNIDPLRIARLLSSKKKNVLLHMSCDMMKADYLKKVLIELQEMGICNLFLVLGENYQSESSDFQITQELINFIRELSGDYFCIGVPGFPGCSDEKIFHLKSKIKSGADFIITQAFFDINVFKSFRKKCKMNNIHVPIIPGLFPFESYTQLNSFINLCKIKVSSDLLEMVKNKDDRNESCSEVLQQMIRGLCLDCNITHIHFFTLNKLGRVNNFIETMLL